MIIRTRNHPGILLFSVFLIFAAPAAARADNLFRLYPEAGLSGFYSDNVPMRTSNETGDFAGLLAAGFYLDYTSAARYASLHYDTFAQLFAHQTQYDRAGEGQFVSATDDENLSPTTKLRLDEFFYRDAPSRMVIITSDQAPQFNTVAAELLLANDRASINQFNAYLSHYWGRNWVSVLSVHQTTFWATGNNNSADNSSYDQSIRTYTDYHFSDRFSLGAGYRFYDFQFSRPGLPSEQAHYPFVRATWLPMQNLYFEGMVGVVISHTQGSSQQAVNPGGMGALEYDLQHAHLKIYGGQQPEVTSGLAGAGLFRFVRGNIFYDFTPRLTGNVGAGFGESQGSNYDGQIISWGLGLNDRVNKWLSVYTRFVELRREETTSSQFLPSGTQNGKEAVGDYFVVGFNVSVEAFRWSWQ
jgi:hypothetical protein